MSNNSSSSSSSSSSAQSEHSQDSIDLDELPVVEVHEDEKNKEIDNKSTDLPHTGGITLDQLPDEIILKICRFLNTASFGKLSLASKRFVPILEDLETWEVIAKNENYYLKRLKSKKDFIEKYLDSKEEMKRLEEQHELQRQQRKREWKKRKAAICMMLCFVGKPWEFLLLFSIVLLSIFIPLKADRVIEWDWVYILIPLYLIMFQILMVPIVYMYFRLKFDDDFEDFLEPDKKVFSPLVFFILAIWPLRDRKKFPTVAFSIGLGLLLLGFTFLILKMTLDPFPWWVVFLPGLALLTLFLVVMLFGGHKNIFTDERRFDRIAIICGLACVATFIVFLFLRLDEKTSWNWKIVFVPLFVLEASLFVVPMILSFIKCCFDDYLFDRSRWNESTLGLFLISLGVAVFLLAPLVTFEVLIAQRLQFDITTSWVIIFVPIFIIEGLIFVGCLILCCIFYKKL